MRQANILMLGTDVSTKGGIASVVMGYIDSGLMSRLNIEYIPTHRDGSKLEKICFFLRQFPKIILKLFSVDIVHIHSSHGWSFRRLVFLLFCAHSFGKKTILHVHGSQFDNYYDNAGKAERIIIGYGLRIADVVIALSQDWKEKLLQMQPSANVVVVRNGVNYVRYQQVGLRSLHTPVNILFLGRLGERKGIYDILDSILEVDSSAFKFVLAGDGDLEQVRNIVSERGWGTFVRVPGWVDPEEKLDLLQAADLYLLPSYHEGLPISILEAMAAGLPVISTPVGGIPEAVIEGRNGYLVSPGDSSALATCIKAAVADSANWERMSNASQEMARDMFDMSVVETQLKKIYGSLQC